MNSKPNSNRPPTNKVEKTSPKKEEISQSKKGLISTPAKAIATVSRTLSAVPYIGEVAAVVSPVASVVAGIAETFGYNKPANLEPRCYLKPTTLDNPASASGLDTIGRLSMLPDARVVAGVHAPDNKDYGLFENYKMLPALIQTFNQDPNQDIGTELTSWQVSPCYCHTDVTSSVLTYTPNHSYNLASRHMYWTGSMKYFLIAFTQPFVSTRIRITWFPEKNHSDPSVNTYGGNYYSTVHDISGTTVIPFSIPYLSDVKFKLSTDPYSLTTLGADSDHLYANGMVSVNVVNAIAAPTSTVSVEYALFQSCGEDMLFAQPQPQVYPPSSVAAVKEVKNSNFIPKGELDTFEMRSLFETSFNPIHPAKAVFEDKVNFPNYINDWRTFWHRYSQISGPQTSYIQDSSNNLIYSCMVNPGDYYVKHVSSPQQVALTDFEFCYFNNFFQFRRGSKRYIVIPAQYGSEATPDYVKFQWLPPVAPLVANTYMQEISTTLISRYGSNLQYTSDRAGYETEIPYMSNLNVFCSSIFKRDIDYVPDVHLTVKLPTGATFPGVLVNNPVSHSVGDDYAWICPRASGRTLQVNLTTGTNSTWRAKGIEDDGNPVEGIEVSETNQQSELTGLADVSEIETTSLPTSSDLWIPPRYEKAEISSILNRWYQTAFKWSSTDAVGSNIFVRSFPEDWINSQPFVREKLNNFQFMRGHFRVQFRINATKMHAGGLLISYLPHYNDRGNVQSSDGVHVYEGVPNAFQTLAQASLNPCAYMDASNNITLTVDIPGTTPLEFYNIPHYNDYNYNGWFGEIHVFVLSNLRNLENTATDVDVTVSYQFVDAELYGPTVSVVS